MEILHLGIAQNQACLLGCPYDTDYILSGSMLGSRYFGKLVGFDVVVLYTFSYRKSGIRSGARELVLTACITAVPFAGLDALAGGSKLSFVPGRPW